MNESERHISDMYGLFETHGMVELDDEAMDSEAMRRAMTEKVDEFEADIETAYEDNKSERSSSLTKAAFLRLSLDGVDEEQMRQFMAERKLSRGMSTARRQSDAVKHMSKTHKKAQAVMEQLALLQEYAVEPTEVRRIYDTLLRIKDEGTFDEAIHGALMVLFDTIKLGDNVRPQVASQLRFNAISQLRPRVAAVDLSETKRVAEGGYVIGRVTGRAATGFITVGELAQEFAHDKVRRKHVPYTDDIVQNRAMIETYTCEALDVLYPPRS